MKNKHVRGQIECVREGSIIQVRTVIEVRATGPIKKRVNDLTLLEKSIAGREWRRILTVQWLSWENNGEKVLHQYCCIETQRSPS